MSAARSKATSIRIVPPDPAWAVRAEEEIGRITAILGDILIGVEHIGSTSVPGLAAKSVIDLLPLVADISDVDRFQGAIEAAGYNWYGEYGLPGRRYLNRDDETGLVRLANVHIFAVGNPEVERHIAFRDYLRAHPALANQYSEIKAGCAERFPSDVNGYSTCKNDWIQNTERAAVAWYRGLITPSS